MARRVKVGGLRAQMEQDFGIVVSRGVGMGVETLDGTLEGAGREPSMGKCAGARCMGYCDKSCAWWYMGRPRTWPIAGYASPRAVLG